MHSTAVLAAVSKPMVYSVQTMSLSMVPGRPMQGMPALDAYMDQVQKDYGRTITEYVNHWDKTHQHLKKPGNWDPWLKGLKMAEHQAEEIAIRNVIEAL